MDMTVETFSIRLKILVSERGKFERAARELVQNVWDSFFLKVLRLRGFQDDLTTGWSISDENQIVSLNSVDRMYISSLISYLHEPIRKVFRVGQ